MNKKYFVLLLSTALLALTGCSNDESGGELADGKYPLELRAEGLAVTPATTRATVDGDWQNVTRLAVMVDGVMKEYDVTPDAADNKKAKLSRQNDPFYWKIKTESMTVSAWWRYNDASSDDVTQLPVMRDLNDQHQLTGYRSCDYIYAEPQQVTFDNPTLVFKHRTAKIAVNLKSAIGGSLSADKEVIDLKITVGTKEFTPFHPYDYDHTKDKQQYLLLLVPTTEATSIAVTFTYDGEKYTFRPSTKYNFEANKLYTFNLNVGKDELTLDGCTILPWDADVETVVNGGEAEYYQDYEIIDGVYHVYTADGLKAWRTAAKGSLNTGCVLEEDIKMPAPTDDNGNWTAAYNYKGVFDGNGHTISNLVIKGNYDQGFIGTLDGGTVKNLTLRNPQVYSSGQNGVGAVVGIMQNNATIEHCQVIGGSVETGQNSSNARVGGLVGEVYNTTTITASSASCELLGARDNIGGLVGAISGSLTIKSSFANCTISGGSGSCAGGLVGYAFSASLVTSNVWWASSDNSLNAIGSGNTSSDVSSIYRVDGSADKTWSAATSDMNAGIPADAPYQWQQNDGENNPPVLVKK